MLKKALKSVDQGHVWKRVERPSKPLANTHKTLDRFVLPKKEDVRFRVSSFRVAHRFEQTLPSVLRQAYPIFVYPPLMDPLLGHGRYI